MIEAQIICCNPCDIPDLGIVGLRRGELRWVSDIAARNSNDLRKEQAKGNVRVNRKARRNPNPSKRHAPPFVAQSRPQQNGGRLAQEKEPTPVAASEPEETPGLQEVDTDKLKAELLQGLFRDLAPGLRSMIAEEVGKAAQAAQAQQPPPQQQAPQPTGAIDPAQLEGVLENVLRRVVPEGGMVSSGSSNRKSAKGPEEPLFIPNKIVSKDTKAKIDVTQKATEGGSDLDDAQAALRALRGKKRRKKKNGNEEK